MKKIYLIGFGALFSILLYLALVSPDGMDVVVDSNNEHPLKNLASENAHSMHSQSSEVDGKEEQKTSIEKKHPNARLQAILDIQSSDEISKDIQQNLLSEYPAHAGVNAEFSTYPMAASDVYFNNIEKADSGDDEAQYLVATALNNCRGVASLDQLSDLRTQNNISNDLFQKLSYSATECAAMLDKLGKEFLNDNQNYRKYLALSAKQQHIDALAWVVEEFPAEFDENKALDVVYESMKNGNALSARHLQIYYSKTNGGMSEAESVAWKYIACELDELCDIDLIDQYVAWNYKPQEIEEIFDSIEKIESKIDK